MNILPNALRSLVPAACSLALLSACHWPHTPGPCANTSVQTIGVADGFVPPETAPLRSAPLTAYLATQPGAEQGLDETGGNREFGASFRLGGGKPCTVQVEVGTRVGLLPGSNNDRITIGGAPFTGTPGAPVFHAAQVWPASSTSPQTITVTLPASAVQAYVATASQPMIDVHIQDDTNVDFIRVTHTY